jgi:DNA-binding FadR family transcriptional regulator
MDLLYTEILADLREKIISNILKEGQKLPSERELTQQYGVSRNVVREAISALRFEGLINVYTGKGAYVTKPNPIIITETLERIMKFYKTTIEEILEVREELEKSIIKKAVKTATTGDVQNLTKIYQKMEENKLNLEKFTEFDIEFHKHLAESTKNPIFNLLLNSFIDMTQHVLFVFTRMFPDSVETAQKQHLDLIKAIKTGDEQLAENLIISHMQVLRDEIRVLRENKLI